MNRIDAETLERKHRNQMRRRSRTADCDPFAVEVFRLLDLWSHIMTEVQFLIKVGDTDDIRAAQPGIDEVAGTDDRGVDLAGKQRSDGQRIARHEDELHVDAILFEQAAVARHPDVGHTFAGDAGGQV